MSNTKTLPALWLAWNTDRTGIRFWTADAAVAEAQTATGLTLTGFYSAEQMAALAQPAASGEPAAYSIGRTLHWHAGCGITDAQLYAAPQPEPQADQPLTDARLFKMAAEAETPEWGEWFSDEDALLKFARAIEAATARPKERPQGGPPNAKAIRHLPATEE